MKCLVLLVAIGLGGCDHLTITEQSQIGSHRPPDWIPAASIHPASIEHVGITEQADAAVSVDAIGDVRLWPALDGSREPLQVTMPRPVAVAIAHAGDGDDLLVAGVDQVGIVTLERLSRAGAPRGRATLPVEPAVVQLVAIDGGVLVVRADQTIERYDVAGVRRGRLSADPGEQFGKLARRRGSAVVMTIAGDVQIAIDSVRRAASAHFIELGNGGLVWGRRETLPTAIDATAIALSPNHHRIAVIDVAALQLRVLDATADLREVSSVHVATTTSSVGFVDDDHAVAFDGMLTWWPEHDPAEATKENSRSPTIDSTEGSVGDGVAVGASETSLGLASWDRTRYLGWSGDTHGRLVTAGTGYAMLERDDRTMYLDAALRFRSVGHIDSENRFQSVWIDEHHVIVARRIALKDTHAAFLVDTTKPGGDVALGSFDQIFSFDYDAATRTVAVIGQLTAYRYKLDAGLHTATKLPDLSSTLPITMMRLMDPATHDGIVAVAISYQFGDHWSFLEWHAGPNTTIESNPPVEELGTVRALDGNGAVYIDNGTVAIVRHGVAKTFVPGNPMTIEPSSDGQRVLTVEGQMVVMRDAKGYILWQRMVWDVTNVIFSSDQRQLVVQTAGGVLELDAATGERVSAACGLDFGIHDDPPDLVVRGVPTVCER